ncbi:MAG TPA: metallophosphoesterase [Tepidisphaeraceae bacterium]|jgi:hypothetical protein|nr:metallophosphoesterase [Tepidisphaeraceae bacterium]
MPFNAGQVVETFAVATEENQVSALREQQIINLPAEGEVWLAADIHDHRRNFEKLIKSADLGANPQRHLILQELIHGDHYDNNGAEDSWEMLYKAADLKCDFPGQVHFILANHDLAQIHGEGIMKNGLSVCEAFTAGVMRDFPEGGSDVNVAITEFLLSIPLAIRTTTGLWFSHSLPTDLQMDAFDFTVFNRPLTGADYKRKTGPIYQLIWGRGITPTGVDKFRAKVNANLIVTGHQPQDTGYAINGDHHLIIASDHNQGVFLPLNLSETYDMSALVERLVKFVSLDL